MSPFFFSIFPYVIPLFLQILLLVKTRFKGEETMNATERRDLVKYLISEVELFPREEQKTQKRFVKAIAYKFPIEQKVLTQFDECGASVESVVLLERYDMDGRRIDHGGRTDSDDHP